MGDAEILWLLVQRRIFLCLDENLNVMLTLGSNMHVKVSTSVIVLGSKSCKLVTRMWTSWSTLAECCSQIITGSLWDSVPVCIQILCKISLFLFYVFWPIWAHINVVLDQWKKLLKKFKVKIFRNAISAFMETKKTEILSHIFRGVCLCLLFWCKAGCVCKCLLLFFAFSCGCRYFSKWLWKNPQNTLV